MLTSHPFWNADLSPRTFDDFDRFFTNHLKDQTTFCPACDISETEEHYLMGFDVPGIKKEDLHVKVEENTLTVCGERHLFEQAKSNRTERSYGRFERSFTLPQNVKSESIEAHYQDGVLELVLPKSPEAKQRKIEVQSGKDSFFNQWLGKKKEPQGDIPIS